MRTGFILRKQVFKTMNIHEHQAKEILKEFGAPVSEGIVIFDISLIKFEKGGSNETQTFWSPSK